MRSNTDNNGTNNDEEEDTKEDGSCDDDGDGDGNEKDEPKEICLLSSTPLRPWNNMSTGKSSSKAFNNEGFMF